ncbi:hypothetical protein ACSSS7_007168 [Eimeria intestinalis]
MTEWSHTRVGYSASTNSGLFEEVERETGSEAVSLLQQLDLHPTASQQLREEGPLGGPWGAPIVNKTKESRRKKPGLVALSFFLLLGISYLTLGLTLKNKQPSLLLQHQQQQQELADQHRQPQQDHPPPPQRQEQQQQQQQQQEGTQVPPAVVTPSPDQPPVKTPEAGEPSLLRQQQRWQQHRQQQFTPSEQRKIEAAISILAATADPNCPQTHHAFCLSQVQLARAFSTAAVAAAAAAAAAETAVFSWKRVVVVTQTAVVFEVVPLSPALRIAVGDGPFILPVHLRLQEETAQPQAAAGDADSAPKEIGRDPNLLRITKQLSSATHAEVLPHPYQEQQQQQQQQQQELAELESGESPEAAAAAASAAASAAAASAAASAASSALLGWDLSDESGLESDDEDPPDVLGSSVSMRADVSEALRRRRETVKDTVDRTGVLAPLFTATLGTRGGGSIGGTDQAFFQRRVSLLPMQEADLSLLLQRHQEQQAAHPGWDRIPKETLLHVLRRLVLSVAMLHDAGVLHNQLEFRSIRFNSSGISFLGDLDGRTAIDREKEVVAIHRLSPEQLRGAEKRGLARHTEESDSWQLGLLAYRLLAGSEPYTPAEMVALGRLVGDDHGHRSPALSVGLSDAGLSLHVLMEAACKQPAQALQGLGYPKEWVQIISALLQPDPTCRPTVVAFREGVARPPTHGTGLGAPFFDRYKTQGRDPSMLLRAPICRSQGVLGSHGSPKGTGWFQARLESNACNRADLCQGERRRKYGNRFDQEDIKRPGETHKAKQTSGAKMLGEARCIGLCNCVLLKRTQAAAATAAAAAAAGSEKPSTGAVDLGRRQVSVIGEAGEDRLAA